MLVAIASSVSAHFDMNDVEIEVEKFNVPFEQPATGYVHPRQKRRMQEEESQRQKQLRRDYGDRPHP